MPWLIAHALIARTPKAGDRVPAEGVVWEIVPRSLSIFVWLAITLPLLGWAFGMATTIIGS